LVDQIDAALAGDDSAESESTRQALRHLASRCADERRFLEALDLATEVDTLDPRADRIALLTLHAAKGLEFPVVFIVGCEDGLSPLRFGPSDDVDLAEERRLFFVGMTRAERRLYLCHAGRRALRGPARKAEPSPFLRDIEEALLERGQTRAIKKKNEKSQLDLF
jgi:DNA helicase-2/ATP-dependent DNA helicase PcrA